MARRRGITMLEIVLTVCLLALAIIPVIGSLQTESRQTSMNRDRIFAHHLATNVIERLRMERPSALATVLDDRAASTIYLNELDTINPTAPSPDFATMFPRFRRSAWVEAGSGVDAGKYTLNVLVEWTEAGHDRQLHMNLLLVEAPELGTL